MFEPSADLYDLVYSFKDYPQEAAWVRDAIRARAPAAVTLLDVACGTGKHLEQLSLEFECQGVDIVPRFVEIARGRCNGPVHLGDMDAFDLRAQFDAVVSLFSAIGYSNDLLGAIGSMARHVAEGGVLIVEPWFSPEEWILGRVHVLDAEDADVRVLRMSTSGIDGNVSTLEMHYLVGTSSGVEHFVEHHRLTLFTLDEYEAAFAAAGLTFDVERPGPMGRGALIGRWR